MSRTHASETNFLPQKSVVRRLISIAAVALMAIVGVGLGPIAAQAAPLDSIHGTVTDPVTGAGLEGVTVYVAGVNGTLDTWYKPTDENGEFSFSGIAEGEYAVEFRTLGLYDNTYADMFYIDDAPPTLFRSNATPLKLDGDSNLDASVELPFAGALSGHLTAFDPPTSPYTLQAFVQAFNPLDSSWRTIKGDATDGFGNWEIFNLLPGHYRLALSDFEAVYQQEYYDDVRLFEDGELVVVRAGQTTANLDAELTVDGAPDFVRLAGQDRFATSARIAQAYITSNVVFVANGLDYPDALSAAPAAAVLEAPLLLTRKDSVPEVVKEQIIRLNPKVIYVVGGTGVISNAVFNELDGLAIESAVRLAGSNRYATSLAVFTEIWDLDDAPTVFLADGRNFPDALSSASAAALEGGPVVLVNGGASTIPAALVTELNSHNTTDVILAGGTAVLSSGIENAVNALDGIDAHRYFGANRYGTSVAINAVFFDYSQIAYLAVGTGYADALAGAALAGLKGAPLYLVTTNCIPQSTINDMARINVDRPVLLGGTGVLSQGVANLIPCR